MSEQQTFRLISRENVGELNGILSVYEHLATGAILAHIGDDNPQKLFMIGFRTLPGDDTGVAHIMEHSVLCGSKKYPAKEPFVELMKGSLNTFLNAMTGADFTTYPVMTPNLKDYYNLMDVYLDAVFNPRIGEKPEILMQEGWHYELDSEGALTINGVVYNEMKGAMSSPEEQLGEAVIRTLFTNFYRFNAGGAPAAIPDLTQEQFAVFHKKFYNPGNSCTVIAGDMPIEPVLDYIDEKYFSHYGRPDAVPKIEEQPPHAAPREAAYGYAVPEEQDDAKMTYLSANYLTYPAGDREEALGVMILAQMLFGGEAAPVRKALLNAGVGNEVTARPNHMARGLLQVTVSGAEPDGMARFRAVMDGALTKLAEEGLDAKLVEGAINRCDFELREASFSGVYARIMGAINVLQDWNFGAKIGAGLRYEDELSSIREKAKERYFETLIRKYLIGNNASAYVTLRPEKGLLEKREAAERERLARVKAEMSGEELERVKSAAEALRLWQQTPDSPEALAAIPRLTLADVERGAKPLPVEESAQDGVKLLYFDAFTAGIAYVRAMFDVSGLTAEEKKDAALLAFMLDKLGTAKRTGEELAKDIDVSTGGIATEFRAIRRREGGVYPYLGVTLRCVGDRLPEGLEILADILCNSNTGDRARLAQLTRTLGSMLQTQLQDNAYQYASFRNRSYFREELALLDATEGLGFYEHAARAAKSMPGGADALAERLGALVKKLFTRANLTVALTGQKEQLDQFRGAARILTGGLPEGKQAGKAEAFAEGIRNEGILSASMVQYVSQAYDYEKLGFSYSGKLIALRNFLSSGYLWNNIRVQGGAYGAILLLREDGVLDLVSYRDPNLKETLASYKGVGAYLRAADFTQSDVENNIISGVADLDRPLSPYESGVAAVYQHIAGISHEDKQRERDELLSTAVADFRAAGELFDAVVEKNCICVFGNAEKLRANKELFGALIRVEENESTNK
ncbi:MAG TPA: insulinase family protein [Clostridia bacterium]|nr:insulinase family protein [Clostridia bacterium]